MRTQNMLCHVFLHKQILKWQNVLMHLNFKFGFCTRINVLHLLKSFLKIFVFYESAKKT